MEVQRLRALFDRASQNGVPDIELIKGQEAIKKYEPHCRGLEALWSPHTGIVDWGEVARAYGQQFRKRGGGVHLDFEVTAFDQDSSDPDRPVKVDFLLTIIVHCFHIKTTQNSQWELTAIFSDRNHILHPPIGELWQVQGLNGCPLSFGVVFIGRQCTHLSLNLWLNRKSRIKQSDLKAKIR